jgi:hypothetical protein
MASQMFADGSLDAVFLDGSHEAAAVEADVRAWLPKVRPGGVLAGHDWSFPTVKEGLAKAGMGPHAVQSHLSPSCWVVTVSPLMAAVVEVEGDRAAAFRTGTAPGLLAMPRNPACAVQAPTAEEVAHRQAQAAVGAGVDAAMVDEDAATRAEIAEAKALLAGINGKPAKARRAAKARKGAKKA